MSRMNTRRSKRVLTPIQEEVSLLFALLMRMVTYKCLAVQVAPMAEETVLEVALEENRLPSSLEVVPPVEDEESSLESVSSVSTPFTFADLVGLGSHPSAAFDDRRLFSPSGMNPSPTPTVIQETLLPEELVPEEHVFQTPERPRRLFSEDSNGFEFDPVELAELMEKYDRQPAPVLVEEPVVIDLTEVPSPSPVVKSRPRVVRPVKSFDLPVDLFPGKPAGYPGRLRMIAEGFRQVPEDAAFDHECYAFMIRRLGTQRRTLGEFKKAFLAQDAAISQALFLCKDPEERLLPYVFVDQEPSVRRVLALDRAGLPSPSWYLAEDEPMSPMVGRLVAGKAYPEVASPSVSMMRQEKIVEEVDLTDESGPARSKQRVVSWDVPVVDLTVQCDPLPKSDIIIGSSRGTIGPPRLVRSSTSSLSSTSVIKPKLEQMEPPISKDGSLFGPEVIDLCSSSSPCSEIEFISSSSVEPLSKQTSTVRKRSREILPRSLASSVRGEFPIAIRGEASSLICTLWPKLHSMGCLPESWHSDIRCSTCGISKASIISSALRRWLEIRKSHPLLGGTGVPPVLASRVGPVQSYLPDPVGTSSRCRPLGSGGTATAQEWQSYGMILGSSMPISHTCSMCLIGIPYLWR